MNDGIVWIGAAVFLAILGYGTVQVLRMGPRRVWARLRYDRRREGNLAVGVQAPDVMLTALDGRQVHLHDHLRGKPLVLIFGSYT